MAPSALIVAPYWGTPLEGGASAANRHLIRQLKVLGMDVHCLILKATKLAEEEAKEIGVKLMSPHPIKPTRADKPRRDWLIYHKIYFPGLKELEHIKLVVGFGMLSSCAARDIRQLFFKEAKFILINTWPLDNYKFRDTYGFEQSHYGHLLATLLENESEEADVVFSLFSTTYNDLAIRYERLGKHVIHKELIFTPDVKCYELPRSVDMKNNKNKCILSAVELEDHTCKGQKDLAKILIPMTQHFVKFNPPPKWVIFDIPEKEKQNFTANKETHLDCIAYEYSSPKELDFELICGDLAIPSGRSTQLSQFALTAMARGIPTLVPRHSDSHSFVTKYLAEYEHGVVIDMNDKEALTDKIISVLNPNEQEMQGNAVKVRKGLKKKCELLNCRLRATLKATLNSNLSADENKNEDMPGRKRKHDVDSELNSSEKKQKSA